MKMIKNRQWIYFVLCACFFALFLTGCNKESSSAFSFGRYKMETEKEEPALDKDEEMTLDGYLDEDVWTAVAANETILKSSISDDIYMKTRCYITEKGVYFGVVVYDSSVYYNENRKASRNTSAEIYMKGLDGEYLYNLRLVPTGEEGGVEKEGVVFYYSRAKSTWLNWTMAWEGAANVQGPMNSGKSVGYTAEAFVPWDTLGATPSEYIAYLPAFNHVETSSENDSSRIWVGTGTLSKESTYYTVNNEGIFPYAEIADGIIEYDDTMKVDGKLDEGVWSKTESMKYGFTTSGGTEIALDGKYYATQKGAYFGFEVKEPYIFYSDKNVRQIGLNSGMELYFAPSGTTKTDKNTLQLRITANNVTARYRASKTTKYPWDETYFPMVSATTIQGTLNSTNVAGNTGYTMELFIPWDAFGLSEKPSGVLVYPVVIHSEDVENSAKTKPQYQYCSFYTVKDSISSVAHNPSEQYLLFTDKGVCYSELEAPSVVVTESALKGDSYYKTISFTAAVSPYKEMVTRGTKTVVPTIKVSNGITYSVNSDSTVTLKIPKSALSSLKNGLTYQAVYNGVSAKGSITYSSFDAKKPVAYVNFANGTVKNSGTNGSVTAGTYLLNNTKGSTAFVATDIVNYLTGHDGTKLSAIVTNHKTGAYTVLNGLNLAKNDFTVSTWFCVPKGHTLDTGNKTYILGTSKADDTSDGFRVTLREEDGTYKFGVRTGSNSQTKVEYDDFAYGKWYNLTVVREGKTMKYYIDGQLLITESISKNFSFGNKALSFGAYIGDSWTYQDANMFYDEIRVYNMAVDQSLVREIMTVGSQ